MSIKRKIFLGLGVLLLLAAAGLFIRDQLSSSVAGLVIETQPTSTVFINGIQVGATPYRTQRNPEEITVKLVPFSQDIALMPYETQVTLVPGVETVIRRSFAPTEEASHGELLAFEKLGGSEAALAIVTFPDAVQVEIDGVGRGFSPLRIDGATAGDHTVRLSVSGYEVKELTLHPTPGYLLTAVVKLATTPQTEEEDVQGTTSEKQIVVEIRETPTGFLRVRSEPSIAASESARVSPGRQYPFIEQNEAGDWFKIEYEENKTGWVTAEYAKKIEKTL